MTKDRKPHPDRRMQKELRNHVNGFIKKVKPRNREQVEEYVEKKRHNVKSLV